MDDLAIRITRRGQRETHGRAFGFAPTLRQIAVMHRAFNAAF